MSRRVFAVFLLVVATWSNTLRAQPPDDSVPTPKDVTLARAKQLFKEGNELRRSGDCEGALIRYAASRALVASVPNTINAAYCLNELHRYDEALELYEELITKFGDELSQANRTALAPEMTRLRQQLGSLEIAANVDGILTIDGRPRGALPRLTPVRVLPGSRKVMVTKDGFRTFEKSIDVTAGQTLQLEARLEPLTVIGRAEILDDALAGAEVFIDEARVGAVPWQGSLAPGPHTFFVRHGELGTAPQAFVVVEGQVAELSAELLALGPALEITTKPTTATLRIGETNVGRGRWQGRLPLGKHTIVAQEEGYFDAQRILEVTRRSKGTLELRLDTDEAHPRWGVTQGTFVIDVWGGLALGPTLSTGAEATCGTAIVCADDPIALGLLVGARGGYAFSFGLSVEVAGGYLRAHKTLERVATRTDSSPAVTYAVIDGLRVSGPFGAAGLGYRYSFAEMFEARAHVLAGALYAFASDDMSATASGGAATTGTRIVNSGAVSGAPTVIVLPSIELGLRVEDFGVGLGLLAAVIATDGADQKNGEIHVDGSDGCAAGELACVNGYTGVAGERGFGPFVLITPTIFAGYQF